MTIDRRAAVICLALVGAGAFAGLLGALPVAAADRSEARFALDWFDEMQAYYDAHPELKETPGSGWKPFNRLRWFHTQRMSDGELAPFGARWEASQVRQARQAGVTARTNWFSLGPANFSGRILSLEFDPTDANILYAGAAGGGVWKSTDNGVSWAPMSDEIMSLAVGGIAVDPLDPNIVVIGTGEGTFNIDRVTGVGILRSTDGGATWNTTSLSYPQSPYGSGGHGFHVIEANPLTGTMLAGATDGLWRSSDSGATWTQVRVGDDHYDVVWRPGDANVCYAAKGSGASGNSVKKSTDDGLTFATAGTGQANPFSVGKTKMAVSANQPDWVYAVYILKVAPYTTLGVYRTTDNGGTWVAQNTTTSIGGGQGWYNLSLAADPNAASTLIAGGVSLFRSVDAGIGFAVVGGNVHVDHHAVAYEPGSDTNVWVGTDGGIWKSTNDGFNWPIERNTGLVTYQFYDICVNNNNSTAYYVMGGTQDNGTDKWSGTTTWANGLGADGMVCNINPVNGTTVYAEIQFGGQRKNTTSGTGAYSTIMTGITGAALWVAPVAERANPGDNLFTSTGDGIFQTTNGGGNWANVDAVSAVWISVSLANGDHVWTVAGGPRFSTNNGASWTAAAPYGFTTSGATKILAHPTDANSVFVTFGSYAALPKVALSTDLGSSWSDVTGDLPPQPVNAIAVNPSNPTQWYIGTDTGVWTSENGGVNWLPFEAGLPNVVVVDLEIQDNLQKLVAGTHGRGTWEIDIPSPLVGVNVADANLSRNLMLDSPFPNPVTDRTLLRYAAKSGAKVTLAVYDVQGRLVNDLADFESGDGIIRTTPWFTDGAPSGVYFAVLKSGEESISRKIVVTR